jgi:hypothetical protein
MRIWLAAVSLALTLAAVPGAAQPEEAEVARVGGVVSYIDLDRRTFQIGDDGYTVPPEVPGLNTIEPGTAVLLEYRQVGEERRVESLRIRRD